MNIQTLTNKIQNDPILNNLASFFDNEIYAVGGTVRDFLMGKNSYDRDLIVVDEDAKSFSLKVAQFLDGVFLPLDEENKIYRIVLKDKKNFLDITNPIGGSLEEDILRRDITINAIATNIKTGEIPSFCEFGIRDIQNKIIQGIKEENFTDDPLRLLRVFRFYAILGFEISPKLLNIIKTHAGLINKPAKERVEYELMKLFDGKFTAQALLKMDESGILEEIFPFVKELKQVPPNLHHHLDLFHHSIETVNQVQKFYETSSKEVQEHLERIDFGGFSRLAHLKLAAFMHDIGKFSTWTIEPDTGRHRFIKHEDVGAKLAVPILKKMCFSNKQIDYISYIIKKHMYPTAVVSAPELSDKVMMRYVRKSEDNAIDTIIIAKADRVSAQGPEITKEIVEENLTLLDKLLQFYLDSKETLAPLPKLLDGKEVMAILNIKPSPLLGKILNELHEAQISGDILTKDDAVRFIKSIPIDSNLC